MATTAAAATVEAIAAAAAAAFHPGLHALKESQKIYGEEFRIRMNALQLMKPTPFEKGHSLASLRQGIANLPDLLVSNKWNQYAPVSCSELNADLLAKVWPAKHADLVGNLRILRAIYKESDEAWGVPVYKVILQNKETGAIVFTTGMQMGYEDKNIPAVTAGWFVWKKDMVAPLGFWEMVRDCL